VSQNFLRAQFRVMSWIVYVPARRTIHETTRTLTNRGDKSFNAKTWLDQAVGGREFYGYGIKCKTLTVTR